MKKLFLIFLVFCSLPSFACDICGCGTGSYYLGLMPEYNKQFFGLRFKQNSLRSHLNADGKVSPLTSFETYKTTELWAATNLGKSWRIMAILPYNFNERNIPGKGEQGKLQGLGDALIMGSYKLIDERKSEKKFINQTLFAGIGLKLPTGQYNPDNVNSTDPNYFQLGTGSLDYILNLSHDLRIMDAGINTNLSYKINSQNQDQYKYANKFTGTLIAYHKFLIKNQFRITPNLGLNFETQAKDKIFNSYEVYQSGGNVLAGILGLETQYKKIGLGINYQNPLYQNLAEKRILSNDKWQLNLSFIL